MALEPKLSSDVSVRRSLGKGEVVSSILTGSTAKQDKSTYYCGCAECDRATQYATKREHDVSGRGKSVEFDRRLFQDTYTDLLRFRDRHNDQAVVNAAGRVLRGLWTIEHNKVPPPGAMTMLAADVAALAALIDRKPQAIDIGRVGALSEQCRDV